MTVTSVSTMFEPTTYIKTYLSTVTHDNTQTEVLTMEETQTDTMTVLSTYISTSTLSQTETVTATQTVQETALSSCLSNCQMQYYPMVRDVVPSIKYAISDFSSTDDRQLQPVQHVRVGQPDHDRLLDHDDGAPLRQLGRLGLRLVLDVDGLQRR
jgi:hypothetical protein